MNSVNNDYRPSLIQEMCRWAYSFLLLIVIPFAFISAIYRGTTRSKKYNNHRLERFGLVCPPPKINGYLFHCVSVGEVVTASCLIRQIMHEEPDAQITITTTTATGAARVNAIFAQTVHHFYLPYDLPIAMAKMLQRLEPKAVLITEVELWPNLIHACWKRFTPVMVINARMTDRSANRYAKISWLFDPMLHKLSHICAQGNRDYQNYLGLGAHKRRVTQTNNIKFDQAGESTNKPSYFMGLSKSENSIIVAGSTHDSEERMALESIKTLWSTYPEVILLLVPRHPERFEHVAALIENMSEHFVRTSQTNTLPAGCRIVLLDEMGRLNLAYQVANIAFVGGSLVKKGGHNALEPAAAGVPVIMGPNTFNNPMICDYLQQKGALSIVNNTAEFTQQCQHWLANPQQAEQAGIAGYQVLEDNRGALNATLACMHSVLTNY